MATATPIKKDIQKLQRAIVDGLQDVKAQDIRVFDTTHQTPLFERVIVASGTSNRQTKALAASVRDAVREAGFAKPRTEGEDNGEWIIVDCGPAVAHIMQPAIRQYYNLEEIWGEKPLRLKFGEPKPAKPAATPATTPASASAKTADKKDGKKGGKTDAKKDAKSTLKTAGKTAEKAEGKKTAKTPSKTAAKPTTPKTAKPAKATTKAPAKRASKAATPLSAAKPTQKTSAKTASKSTPKAPTPKRTKTPLKKLVVGAPVKKPATSSKPKTAASKKASKRAT